MLCVRKFESIIVFCGVLLFGLVRRVVVSVLCCGGVIGN